MDISLSKLDVGNNIVSLGENVLSFSDGSLDADGLKISVYRKTGGIWENGAELQRKTVFQLRRPQRPKEEINTVSDLKNYTSGAFTRYLGCISSSMEPFLSPAIDKISERFSSDSLSTWADSTGRECDYQLKAMVLDFLWGLVIVYPEAKISIVPGRDGNILEANIFFKLVDDPFFTIGFSYRNVDDSTMLALGGKGAKYQIVA
ncbi:hypothetical protein IJG78_04070 [Candidatus Saccharibacteria bacterium]|nr:hypothetical protein [Candidatus Saccharibacteria bacterium]